MAVLVVVVPLIPQPLVVAVATLVAAVAAGGLARNTMVHAAVVAAHTMLEATKPILQDRIPEMVMSSSINFKIMV